MADNCKEAQCLTIPSVKNTDCPTDPEKTPVIFGNAELLGGDTSPIELNSEQIKLLCEGVPPCGEITPDVIRAYNTAIYWQGKQIENLCQRLKAIEDDPCGFISGCDTGSFNFIPLTTVHSDSSENLVQGNLPYTTNVNVPASVPADYKGLVLRVYFELDNRNDDVSTIQLRLTINDQVMGTVEHGGQNVTDDSFWNGDFFVPPNPSDPTKIKINPTIDFNSAGDPDGDVYAVVIKVVGYI